MDKKNSVAYINEATLEELFDWLPQEIEFNGYFYNPVLKKLVGYCAFYRCNLLSEKIIDTEENDKDFKSMIGYTDANTSVIAMRGLAKWFIENRESLKIILLNKVV